jgi:ADP-ribosylation factor-like protein 1
MLDEEELKETVIAVFANKQDLEGALTPEEISEKLGLSKIKNRQVRKIVEKLILKWSIFKTSAKTGEGLKEGLDWLCTALEK